MTTNVKTPCKDCPFMAKEHLKNRPPEKLLAEQLARQSNIHFK